MSPGRAWPALAAIAALILVACAGTKAPGAPAPAEPQASWRQIATKADRDRMRRWWEAWQQGLAEARAAGHGPELEAEGPLLVPDAALPGSDLPSSHFRCRTIKLGARAQAGLAYVTYPFFECAAQAEGSVIRLMKLTGSQRLSGLVYPDSDWRSVFIGTLELGDEQMPMDYGLDASRDMIGMVERIGPNRWRLVLPWPAFESKLDVIELVPAAR